MDASHPMHGARIGGELMTYVGILRNEGFMASEIAHLLAVKATNPEAAVQWTMDLLREAECERRTARFGSWDANGAPV